MKFGFVAGTYESQSLDVSADLTMNFYPELIENISGKTKLAMYPTPGLKLFATLGSNPKVRGSIQIDDRYFAVAGTNLYEVDGSGAETIRGTVADDGLPVSFATSTIELLVSSGGALHFLTLATNLFTDVPSGTITDVRMVEYIDGFFLALLKDSQIFRISAPLDASSWPALQVNQVSVFPDNVVSFIADHRELWLFGKTKSVVYYDSGSAAIFDVIPGAFIETGGAAFFGAVNLDNTILWIGTDKRGGLKAWRANGYTPQRISNHAIEFAWQGYSTVSDAISYAYQDQGHDFWVIYFPTADKTWVYDVSTNMWHERGFLELGVQKAHLGRCHTYVFGKHLVGARDSGKVYEMNISFYDDDGSPLRRARRAQHISNEEKWVFYHKLQIDLETGIGPSPPLLDGGGNARDPIINLRWSDDGGHSWSNERSRGAGKIGVRRTRVIWRRMGRSRDRVFEISMSDPVPWRIIAAYLGATRGVA